MSKAKSDKVSPDLDTPTDLPPSRGRQDFGIAVNLLLADAFALYVKTKNFHWHVSGRHFRDYHLMLDQQSDAIFAHHRSTGRTRPQTRRHHAALDRPDRQAQTIKDNNEDYVPPREMLRELMEDNKTHGHRMRKAHELADEHEDSGTAGILETFIDETERRTWFLFEASRQEGGNEA